MFTVTPNDDKKNKDWDEIFINITLVILVFSFLIPFFLICMYVSITVIQDIIALF